MKNILLPIVVFILVSCSTVKPVYIPVEVVKKEYINIMDSIYFHDSIYYEIKSKNDTVFETKYKYKTIEKYNTDTIIKIDSIPVIKEVEKYIETNKVYWWLKTLMFLGILPILFFIYKIFK